MQAAARRGYLCEGLKLPPSFGASENWRMVLTYLVGCVEGKWPAGSDNTFEMARDDSGRWSIRVAVGNSTRGERTRPAVAR